MRKKWARVTCHCIDPSAETRPHTLRQHHKFTTCLWFDRPAEAAARAVKHVGRLQQGKNSLGPQGHMALVIDTEGNRIGLHSMQ